MKSFITLIAVLMMSTSFAETKRECKLKGFKFDKKKQSCKETKTGKRKRCEKAAGKWNESSGKCSGKLKGKEKRAFKLVKAAAKKSKYGKQLSASELVELAKDLAAYSKKNKVRLKKIKITFNSTGKQNNMDANKLKEISSKKGVKLYHIDEGSESINSIKEKIDITYETMEKDIEIPTNFFPPNEYNYTAEGEANLLNAIIDEDPSWQIFNITIVESSASKLANTAGKYDFKSSDNDNQKKEKLKGLALARSSETANMLKKKLVNIKVTDKKNAIVSGPKDVFGTGDQSGEQAPSDIINAAKKLNSSNRKKVTEFYNQYQYVKLKVEYMKETKELVKVLEENVKTIPNAEGILAKFSHNKKIKKTYKRKKLRGGKKFRIKRRKKSKRYKPKKTKRRKKSKYKPLACPKW